MNNNVMNEAWRYALIGMIRRFCYQKAIDGQEFTLASGRKTKHYFDLRALTLRPDSLSIVAKLIIDEIPSLIIDGIAAVPLAGCPIATAVSLELLNKNQQIPVLYIRKEVKNHGTKKLIENPAYARNVIIVDDVLTTGESLNYAVSVLEQNNLNIQGIFVLLDRRPRQERDWYLNTNNPILIKSLFTAEDIVDDFEE